MVKWLIVTVYTRNVLDLAFIFKVNFRCLKTNILYTNKLDALGRGTPALLTNNNQIHLLQR